MIDWHCHILPGIDDGASTVEESVEIARILESSGFTSVYCTPHLMKGSYESDNAAVRKAVADLQEVLDSSGIHLRLFPGREYCLDEYLSGYLHDPLPLGDSRFILLEIPERTPPDCVIYSCTQIGKRGFVPLIAHPERCRLFDGSGQAKNTVLEWFTEQGARLGLTQAMSSVEDDAVQDLSRSLRELGCAFQGNLGSLAGYYGVRVRQVAVGHLRHGLYSHFGSDAHSARQLGGWLAEGIAAVSGCGDVQGDPVR